MTVATTLLKKNDEVLLILKPSGRYGMPGGKTEYEELPIKTAAREFFEETNLKVNNLSLCAISQIETTKKSFELYTFFSNDFDGEMVKESAEGILEWIPISKINDIPLYKGDYDIIAHVLEKYEIEEFEFKYDENFELLFMEE